MNTMNGAETKRAEELVLRASRNALNRLKREHPVFSDWNYRKQKEYIESVFDKSIAAQCEKIIKAAQVKPAVNRQFEQEKKRRKTVRKELADELLNARKMLFSVRLKIQNAEKIAQEELIKARKEFSYKIKELSSKIRIERARFTRLLEALNNKSNEISLEYNHRFNDPYLYPQIPKPTDSPTDAGGNLPRASGIYFIWKNDCIEYVGQAKRLCDRVRLGSHHILRDDHMISFVLIEQRLLTWSERYYIGICKPQLNFGRSASHFNDDHRINQEITRAVTMQLGIQ